MPEECSNASTTTTSKFVYISAAIEGCTITIARRNLDYETGLDEYFWEPDYTLAGSTGFLLWPGSWVVIDLLRGRLGQLLRGKRLVELGSGTGLAGLCAAAAGAHVLLTDLPSVLHGILDANVARNARSSASSSDQSTSASPAPDTPAGVRYPDSSSQACTSAACGGDSRTSAAKPWAGSVPVGTCGGTATTMPLDWSVPLGQQLSAPAARGNNPSTTDYILACDVVWLKELLHPMRDVVVQLLNQNPAAICLLAFLDRAKSDSQAFTSYGEVVKVFEEAGCAQQLYHSQQVEVEGETLQARVLEISLTKAI
mmetsp:Transcript_26917/g.58781  ORF Transcript_26917/g.58781 Transcript_26917/m.58781 type:complete len:312 (+) Transcript_26917:61-996(+)